MTESTNETPFPEPECPRKMTARFRISCGCAISSSCVGAMSITKIGDRHLNFVLKRRTKVKMFIGLKLKEKWNEWSEKWPKLKIGGRCRSLAKISLTLGSSETATLVRSRYSGRQTEPKFTFKQEVRARI